MTIKRTRFSRRNGKIDQVFRINERGDGLGRVADIRPDCSRTSMNECFKFPLGLWQQGEVRRCRDSRITILEIDFEYHCVPHALKFDWNGEGVYVFSPDRGLVAIVHGVD
ncbi:MAG: hypothetical protein EXQ92_09945 [Alphaproteobacteria bacterium]|nr:hypothetical protein [Alphaproteobacteria bacterium]